MHLEQTDRYRKSLHFKFSEHEFGPMLFTTRSSLSVTMAVVFNKEVNDLSDQLSCVVRDNTKKMITIPRNICGRIWDGFSIAILYF